MNHKFKQGDRVKHIDDPKDTGTFVRYDGDYLAIVRWEKDGETSNLLRCLYLIEDNSDKEQEAVMLLLSLGYTLSKESK